MMMQELFRLRANGALLELDVRLNPVTTREPHSRLFLVHILPRLRQLNDLSVTAAERGAALVHFTDDQSLALTWYCSGSSIQVACSFDRWIGFLIPRARESTIYGSHMLTFILRPVGHRMAVPHRGRVRPPSQRSAMDMLQRNRISHSTCWRLFSMTRSQLVL